MTSALGSKLRDVGQPVADDVGRGGFAGVRAGEAGAVPDAGAGVFGRAGEGRDDRLGIALGAEARVIVDEADMAGGLQAVLDDVLQRDPRPGRLDAAVEDAMRMAVLAAGDGLLHGHPAMLLGVSHQRPVGPGLRLLGPFRRADSVGEGVIGLVGREVVEVHPVAVQVHIVVGDAPAPGKAMGVDGVDEQDGHAGRRAGYARPCAASRPGRPSRNGLRRRVWPRPAPARASASAGPIQARSVVRVSPPGPLSGWV